MARQKKRRAKKKRKPCAKPKFRQQVEAKVVDHLLYRFVSLIKRGLELLLSDPSALTRKEFRQDPDLVFTAADIPVLVLWAALGAYELAWEAFCNHVLTHSQWVELLGVETQADLDRLYEELEKWPTNPVRLVELAVHDGLKEGDKQETRPEAQRPPVQDEFAEFIGASRVLKLLKKRLRRFLKQLDAQDPKHPRHIPVFSEDKEFVLV